MVDLELGLTGGREDEGGRELGTGFIGEGKVDPSRMLEGCPAPTKGMVHATAGALAAVGRATFRLPLTRVLVVLAPRLVALASAAAGCVDTSCSSSTPSKYSSEGL